METKKISLSNEEIKKLIPHRYPFLMIDKIKNLVVNESAIGIKNITINEDFFQGHFPSFPVMPGVLILESLAQTAACLVSYSNIHLQNQKVVFLTGIDNARFKKPGQPGDTLELSVNITGSRKNFYKFDGKVSVNNDLIASANFSAMLSI